MNKSISFKVKAKSFFKQVAWHDVISIVDVKKIKNT
jgi:hypothetical protein